jgi:hypothetical protein
VRHERPLLVKDGITSEKWPVNLACDSDSHVNRRVVLHAASLGQGTDGVTFPLKEGILWIFSAKIEAAQTGFNSAFRGLNAFSDTGVEDPKHPCTLPV